MLSLWGFDSNAKLTLIKQNGCAKLSWVVLCFLLRISSIFFSFLFSHNFLNNQTTYQATCLFDSIFFSLLGCWLWLKFLANCEWNNWKLLVINENSYWRSSWTWIFIEISISISLKIMDVDIYFQKS